MSTILGKITGQDGNERRVTITLANTETTRRSNSESEDLLRKRKQWDTSISFMDGASSPYKKKENPVVFDLLEALESFKRHQNTLERLVESNPNTKKEIKEAVLKLKKNVEVINRDTVTKWLEEHKWEKVEKQTFDIDCQTEAGSFRQKGDTIDANTQTEAERDPSLTPRPRLSLIKQIRDSIMKVESYKDYRELAGRHWPPQVYERVEEVVGNPVWEMEEKDVVVCVDGKDFLDKGIGRQLRLRHPELAEVNRETVEKEGFSYIKYETSSETAGKTNEVIKRFVYLVAMADTEEATFDNVGKWMRWMVDCNRTRVALPKTDKNWERMKKMVEVVMTGTGIKVMAYSPPNKGGAGKKEETQQNARVEQGIPKVRPGRAGGNKGRKDRDVLFLKEEGVSYRDLLMKIKKVDIKAMGVDVTSLRKTRGGEMLIEINGGRGAADPLRSAIEKVGGVAIRTKKAGRVVVIRDLDATTNKEEIGRVIAEETKLKENEIVVEKLKPAFGESQTAEVRLPEKAATELLQKGSVRVGWLRCRVRERGDAQMCFRCWGYGHTRVNCKGLDRTKACLKCGKEGHQVRECKNMAFCPKCEKGGHRADSAECPLYRKALKEAGREEEGNLPPSK